MRKLTAIAKVTFQDIARDKVLYNVFLVAVGMLAATWITSKLMGSRPTRLILDLGLGSIQISTWALSVLIGSSILGKEFERRTIHMALSRPVGRGLFVMGKYFGLLWTVAINWFLLCAVCIAILSQVDDGYYTPPSYMTLYMGMFLAFVQAAVIGAFALFFSTLSTFSISVIFSIGFTMVSSNLSYLGLIAEKMHGSVLGYLISGFVKIFPNFEFFHLGTQVTYTLPVSNKSFLLSVLYGVMWIAIALTASKYTVDRKEI